MLSSPKLFAKPSPFSRRARVVASYRRSASAASEADARAPNAQLRSFRIRRVVVGAKIQMNPYQNVGRNLREINTYKFVELRHAESTLAKKYHGGRAAKTKQPTIEVVK